MYSSVMCTGRAGVHSDLTRRGAAITARVMHAWTHDGSGHLAVLLHVVMGHFLRQITLVRIRSAGFISTGLQAQGI